MKTILLTALLGISNLLSSYNTKCNSIINPKVIDVTITGWVLYATSGASDGQITKIDIYSINTGDKVRTQTCQGYSCSVNLDGLAHGTYAAVVTCQYNAFSQEFSI
jgi:hypothetical protein